MPLTIEEKQQAVKYLESIDKSRLSPKIRERVNRVIAQESKPSSIARIAESVFKVPSSALREGIRGFAPGGETPFEAFTRGAVKPESVESFERQFTKDIVKDVSEKASKRKGIISPATRLGRTLIQSETFAKGVGGTVAGQALDILTNPAELLAYMGLGPAGKVIGKTQPGKVLKAIGTAPLGKGFVKAAREQVKFPFLTKLKRTIKPTKQSIQNFEKVAKKEVDQAGKVSTLFFGPRGEVISGKLPTIRVRPTVREATGQPFPRIALETHRQVVQKAAELAISNPESKLAQDASKRVFKRIGEALGAGDIKIEDVSPIAKKYGINNVEFAKLWMDDASTHGKALNVLSQYSRAVGKTLSPEAQKIMGTKLESESIGLYQKFVDFFRKLDRPRRIAMVSQLATAQRNALSQAKRYTVNIFDDALTGMLEVSTGKRASKDAFTTAMADISAIMNRFSKTERLRVNQILEAYPLTEAQLLRSPIHDVTLGGKLSNTLLFFNRMQEFAFRKMSFDAKLTDLLFRNGMNPRMVTDIPEKFLAEASNHALEITFARKAPYWIASLYRNVPFLTTVNPFPRFYSEAFKFLWEFNPTGFLTAASRTKLLGGTGEGVERALSRAMLGSAMLATAKEIRRNPEIGGERWYEIRINTDIPAMGVKKGQVIDTRAFAPFSTYLFLAEIMENPERLRGMDFAQALFSMNRIGGTGLVLIDLLRSDSLEASSRLLKGFVGSYFGAFSVPFRTVSDILAQFIPEEGIARTTRENPLIAPLISNIPFVQRKLPPASRITRGEPFRRESPLLRQLTGLTLKTKTPLEKELDRLNIRRIFPRTGDRTLDRVIAQRAGGIIGEEGNRVLRNREYLEADDEQREKMLKDLFSKNKSKIRNEVFVPYTILKLREKKTRQEQIDYLKRLKKKRKLSKKNLKILTNKRELWIK